MAPPIGAIHAVNDTAPVISHLTLVEYVLGSSTSAIKVGMELKSPFLLTTRVFGADALVDGSGFVLYSPCDCWRSSRSSTYEFRDFVT